MTDLSPQAQAIVDAYENTTDKYDALAAVLRALVNEVVPHEDEASKTRAMILAIVTELENF